MKTHTSKLLGVILFFGGTACTSTLRAQTSFALPYSLTQSSPATAFSINTAGTLTESGPLNSSATLTLSGNPQMVWFPAFAAFRAGVFSSSQTQTSIGQYSLAFGQSNTASGQYSVAFGLESTASGQYSFVTGFSSSASGSYATAMGVFCSASGSNSLAVGGGAQAWGGCSIALGAGQATNAYAVAAGYCATASGQASTATGTWTTANSLDSFAGGQYNVGLSSTGATPSAASWVATDPLFELGNGTGSGSTPKSDALVVYKNGAATFQGVVTVAAGGDIPMYTGQ